MVWSARKAVLVPTDFSEASFAALKEAMTMVDSPSHVHVVHVLDDPNSVAEFFREATVARGVSESRAESALTEKLDTPEFAGVNVIIRSGDAGETIAAVAKEIGSDLIVMPSRGRKGLAHFFLGSVAERVLRLAHCAVLVLRTAPDSTR